MKMKKQIFHAVLPVVAAALMSGCTWLDRPRQSPAADRPRPDVWKTGERAPDHLALAEQLVQKGLYDVALVQLQPVLKKNIPRAFDLAGICARETGNYAGGKAYFSSALGLAPDNASVYNNLGLLHAMNQEPDQARNAFERAAELDPGRPEYQNNLGVLLMAREEYNLAESCFRHSLELNPSALITVNNLALCLGMQHRDDEALKLLMASHPKNDALHNMACICLRRNEPEKAKALKNSLDTGSLSAFDIQTKNGSKKEGGGMPGDIANTIYEDKYQPAMRKD